jgi:DNA repair protein RadC
MDKSIKELIDEVDRKQWGRTEYPERAKDKNPARHKNELFIPIHKIKVVRDGNVRVRSPRESMTNPQKVLALFQEFYKDAAHEIVSVMTFDSRQHFIGLSPVAEGGLDHVYVDAAMVFTRVLGKDNAKFFILAHNHPSSGDPSLSDEDKVMLEEIRRVGILLDRPMVDFMVFGADGAYYSHREIHYDMAGLPPSV